MFIHFAGVKNSPTNQRTRYKLARNSCFSFDRAPLVKTGHTVNMVLFHLQTRVMGSDSGRRQSTVLIVMLAAKSPIKSIKKKLQQTQLLTAVTAIEKVLMIASS